MKEIDRITLKNGNIIVSSIDYKKLFSKSYNSHEDLITDSSYTLTRFATDRFGLNNIHFLGEFKIE